MSDTQIGQTSRAGICHALCTVYYSGFRARSADNMPLFLITGKISKQRPSKANRLYLFIGGYFSFGVGSRALYATPYVQCVGCWGVQSKVPLASHDRRQARLMDDRHRDIHADLRTSPRRAERIHSQRRSDALLTGVPS